jgi:hypothetical protein
MKLEFICLCKCKLHPVPCPKYLEVVAKLRVKEGILLKKRMAIKSYMD